MLVLLFYIGDIRYTIKCDKIREIAPTVTLKQAPQTPDYFAGFFNYSGILSNYCNRICVAVGWFCSQDTKTENVKLLKFISRT